MTEILEDLYKHYKKDPEHIKKGNHTIFENEKQRVLNVLNKEVKDGTNVILLGENHVHCVHSGLECLAVRKLHEIQGHGPIVFHEAPSDYTEDQIKKFHKDKISKCIKIKDSLLKEDFNKAKEMKVIHIPKDHYEFIYYNALNDLKFKKARQIDRIVNSYKNINQKDLNVYRVVDQVYSLNGKIIGCDIKEKMNGSKFINNTLDDVEKIKKNKKLLDQIAIALNSDQEGIKKRDKEMTKIISENLENGCLHIGIFGAKHLEGIKKNLENQGIKTKSIKLKEFGYRENYNIL